MLRGTVIASRYKLDKKLGVGGMGQVWSARHTTTERRVAVKLILPNTSGAEVAKDRFLREARASARIGHPNVIDVFDAGELDDGTLFLAMELLEGVSLSTALRANPPMSLRHYLVALADACRGLGAAHDVGIIHRDVKPANIFLHRDRGAEILRAVVLDFGISKFEESDGESTVSGTVLGSPRYMSPELLKGDEASYDARSDLWAVGVMLFHALSGTWPHEGKGLTQLCIAIGSKPAANIDVVAGHVPAELRVLVKGLLAPVAERYSDATLLAEELENCAADLRLDTLVVAPSLADPASKLLGESLRVRDPWQSMAIPSWRPSQPGRPSYPGPASSGRVSGMFGVAGVVGSHAVLEEDEAPTVMFDGLPVIIPATPTDEAETTAESNPGDLDAMRRELEAGDLEAGDLEAGDLEAGDPAESTAAPLAMSEPPRAVPSEAIPAPPTKRPWGLLAAGVAALGVAGVVAFTVVGGGSSAPATVGAASSAGHPARPPVAPTGEPSSVAESDATAAGGAAPDPRDDPEASTVGSGVPATPPPVARVDAPPSSPPEPATAPPEPVTAPPAPAPPPVAVRPPPSTPSPKPALVGEDLGSGL